jgi:hypothetical protein
MRSCSRRVGGTRSCTGRSSSRPPRLRWWRRRATSPLREPAHFDDAPTHVPSRRWERAGSWGCGKSQALLFQGRGAVTLAAPPRWGSPRSSEAGSGGATSHDAPAAATRSVTPTPGLGRSLPRGGAAN